MDKPEVKDRGWSQYFAKIVRIIPGIRGYQDKNAFRDSDKQVRVKLAEKLTDVKSTLDKAKTDLVNDGKIGDIDIIDRSVNKVDRIRETIRFDSYGYAGYFDRHPVREEDLVKMYLFDLALFDSVKRLQELAETAGSKISAGGDVKTEIKIVENEIDGFEKTFAERKNYEGLGK